MVPIQRLKEITGIWRVRELMLYWPLAQQILWTSGQSGVHQETVSMKGYDSLNQKVLIPIYGSVRQASGFNMSHNLITDWAFKWNIKTMNSLMTFNFAIYRSQDWMWGPDAITGPWRPGEVSNANCLWDRSIQCGAMQSAVYTATAALPDSHSTQSRAHTRGTQMTLLCLGVNDWDILRYRIWFDANPTRSKEMRSKAFKKPSPLQVSPASQIILVNSSAFSLHLVSHGPVKFNQTKPKNSATACSLNTVLNL